VPVAGACFGVGQRFLFRTAKRFRLDEDALPLIALVRARPADDDGTEPRVLAGPARHCRVATGQELQAVEIGTLHAERFFALEPQQAALPQLGAAFRALAVSHHEEYDKLSFRPAFRVVALAIHCTPTMRIWSRFVHAFEGDGSHALG
jgi:hypothetical protein